jgi:hypothetical protein
MDWKGGESMDKRLRGLKENLNHSVLKDIQVTSEEKQRILDSLDKQNKRLIPYPYYLSVVTAVIILLILLVPQFQIEQDQASPILNEALKTEYQDDIYFPTFKQYPISYSSILYAPNGGEKKDFMVTYSSSLGQLMDMEQSERQKVLYGPYDGKVAFRVTYSNFQVETNQSSNIETIGGVDTIFDEIENDNGHFLLVSFNVKNGSYYVEFNLSEELTKEKAISIVENIIEGNINEHDKETNNEKDVREVVWGQLSEEQKEWIDGTWEDGKITKVTLNENMMSQVIDKSYEGREVYLIDFPTKTKSKPNNMIVYADVTTFDYIGNGLVD